MGRGRLEAFSDGVMAIIITVMVLELKVPHGTGLAVLQPMIPVFLSYVLSFLYVAIYWNNHHHLLHTVHTVNGSMLWANLHLLFWLSLVPFVTGWVGENHSDTWPAVLYGLVLLMAALAFTLLQHTILVHEGPGSKLAQAMGRDAKGKASLLIYMAAVGLAFLHPWMAYLLYLLVALLWLVPDRRIEARVQGE